MILSKFKYPFFLIVFTLFSYPLISQDNEKKTVTKLYHYMYSNKDSTYYYANKAIEFSQKENNYYDMLSLYLYSNKSAIYFNDYNQLKKNLQNIDKLFIDYKSNIDTINSINELKELILYDKASYFYKLNNYNESENQLKTLIKDILKKTDSSFNKQDISLLNNSYTLIAKMKTNDEKYELAEEYYNKSIRLIKAQKEENQNSLSNTYRQIGELFKRKKDYKTSNLYLKKAFLYSQKNAINANSLINEANGISENYLALKQYDSAAYYINYIKPYADTNTPYGFLYYQTNAKLNEVLKNKDEADINYKKAIELLNKKWKGLKHVEIAEAIKSYADYYINNKQFYLAKAQNIAAINQVQGNDVISSSINKITLFKLLKQKSEIELHQQLPDTVIKTSKQAIALLDTLKPIFKSKTDKLLLLENTYSLFENGLNAAFKNYKTKKEDAVTDAFFFLEKSKSTLLLESLLAAKANKFSNIPDTFITKEQVYKNTITTLEKQINNRPNNALSDKLFTVKANYLKFLDTLETNYKSYYNLKYNTKVISLENTKQLLNKDTAMVTFFYGDQSIYSLTITPSNTIFNKIPITKQLEQKIIQFQKQISTPDSDINQLKANAKALYQTLLKPGLQTEKVNKLIVLPDGLLTYIPFESLIIKDNYLVENYTVSYINSATLLQELINKEDHKNNLLAFAPEFNGDSTSNNIRSGLQPLPHNTIEVVNINKYYSGKTFIKSNATLKKFKTNAANFGIIHLATHAIFDDTNPEFSYLAFGNKEQDLLYTTDLYNLNLNANLVTLSACESGIGNLKRGEGLLSLARGFYFSGAQSISSTLWKINDASSATLMTDFYHNLSKGQTKNTALQQAKLNFIKNNKDNALSHPYYWSAFIISGNTEALTTSNYWIWISLILVTLVLIWVFIKRENNLT